MGLITLSDLKDQQTLLKKLNRKCCCANGSVENGCCYYEVTRTEIELLATNGELIKGATYKITDRGDLGLWFEAISNTELNPEGVRKMLMPAGHNELGYNSVTTPGFPDSFGNTWLGVYNAEYFTQNSTIINEGDLVIWGGLVWRRVAYPVDGSACDIENPCGPGFECVDGFCVAENNIGSKVDDTHLSAEWEVIPKATFTNHEYVPKLFGVYYDFENDWISSQWDEKNNKFGIEFFNDRSFNFNPVDISDWNWAYIGGTHFFNDNFCIGIWNNTANGYTIDHSSIAWNHLINGAIYENWLSGVIEYNTCEGDIGFNFVAGSIASNSCSGGILSNTVDINTSIGVNSIEFNNNKGSIYGNSNNGNINYNGNSGYISSNTNGNGNPNDGHITNNNNNGDIFGNANLGYISYNINNGDIFNNSSTPDTCNITYNINNGYINGNYAVDVTDTIVNK